uniref:Uncharacterized protein n=1 Tax=Arundo donax TaxID=35708 RepID=A0A0A9C3B1_ARUDO
MHNTHRKILFNMVR